MEWRGVLSYIRQAAPSASGQTDGDLLARFAAGDNEAFAALLRRHGPLVLSVCRRLLGHHQDAEDAFQATFLVLVARAGAVTRRDSLGSWLYRVAYRTALKARNSAQRRHRREQQVEELPHPAVGPAQPEDWSPVHEELDRLPEKYRSALVLCDLQGCSRQEAAALLGLPEGTLSSRLATARRMLGERLSRRGVSLALGALAASALVGPALASSTSSLAALAAAGQLAAIETSVATLARGVMNAMLFAKVKLALAAVLAVGLLSGGILSRWPAPSAEAQPSPAASKPVSQPEAVRTDAWKALAEKALKAAGGEKLRAVKAWSFTERYTAGGMAFVSRWYFQFPDRFRWEDESTQDGKLVRAVTVINGDQGWSAEQGKAHDMRAWEVAMYKQRALSQVAPVLAPVWLSDPNSVLTKLPGAKVGSREATAVKLSRKGAGTLRLYFDTESGRLLKVGTDHKLPPKWEVEVLDVGFSDFRAVGGLVLPHQKALQYGGRVLPACVVAEYKFADALDAKLFEKPVATAAEVKRPAFVTAFLAVKREVDAREDRLTFAFQESRDGLKSEAEREAAFVRVVQEIAKLRAPAAEKVLATIRPHAADPAALDALVWVASKSHGTAPGNEAAGLLVKHHLTHAPTIELACEYSGGPLSWTEPMLRAQLASADLPRADRPRVLRALAEVKQTHSELPELLARATDHQAAIWQWHFGKDLIAEYRKLDAARAQAEAVRLFTELDKKYGKELVVRDITFGRLARAAIFEMKHLSVGKPAPETAGEDIDGVKFRLSDYRGKVVLLAFWGTWCGPCMQMVPHEREIVTRLRDRPFVLIGVNSDKDRTKLKEAMRKAGITWRSFWCGEKGTDGDIPSLWNVSGWPTVYVLDHKGVIRAKNVTGTALDRMLDKLVGEVDAEK